VAYLSRLIALALALLPSAVFAAWPDCVDDSEIAGTWRAGYDAYVVTGCGAPANDSSYASEKACALAYLCSITGGCVSTEVTSESMVGTSPTRAGIINSRAVMSGGGYSTFPQFRIYEQSASPAVCPEECTAYPSGQQHLAVASDKPDSYVPPDSICADNCELIRIPNKYQRLGPSGSRELLVTYQSIGSTCETPTGESVVPNNTEGCVGDWCRSVNAGENCGFHNDQYVCLDSVQPDKCFRNADGSLLCAESAPMPPKPDSGTAGDPATPNDTIQACTGSNSCSTVNYYNSTTVAGSSRAVPSGSGASGSGPIGAEGPVEEGEESSGSVSGGTTCDAAPVCDGDPVQCAIVAQQWRTRCVDAPTSSEALEAIGATEDETAAEMPTVGEVDIGTLDADGGIAAGSCPSSLSLNIMGQSLSFNIWAGACEMAALFAPFVMLMGYLAAAFIFIRGTT